MNSTSLGQRAYQLLLFIVDEMGPRPAGSDGEAKFLDFAEGFFRDRGFSTQRQAVPNVPSPTTMLPMLVFGVAGLLAVAWYLPDAPWAPWLYLATFSLLPKAIRLIRKQVGKKGATGTNLIATVPGAMESARRLILCAHHDTARASRIRNPKLGELAHNLMRLFPFIALALAALGVVRAIDLWVAPFVPGGVWQVLRIILTIALGLWGLFILAYQATAQSKKFSPGANDNGSGVAVLMAAAEALALEPLAHTSVDVIFFSAEENGLIGSEQYVKEHRSDLKGTVVLNLDMVGSGERMTYVTGAGMFPPRRTSARLNAILRQGWPGMRGRWYWMGSSDFASFLAKKIPAASLEASGKGRENVYHTDRDTMDFVEPDLLDEAARIVLDFAAAVDGAND